MAASVSGHFVNGEERLRKMARTTAECYPYFESLTQFILQPTPAQIR